MPGRSRGAGFMTATQRHPENVGVQVGEFVPERGRHSLDIRGHGQMVARAALLTATLMLELLRRLIILNIPGIGEYIAELVRIVESKNGRF